MTVPEKPTKKSRPPLSAHDLEQLVIKGRIGAAGSYMAAVAYGAADIGHFDSLVGKLIAAFAVLITLHGLAYHVASEVRNAQLKRLYRGRRRP